MNPTLLAALILSMIPRSAPVEPGGFPARDGQRVVVLGDSITQSGQYVAYLDAYLATRFPDRKVTLINLGLSSETASGLTEADHPFPRPDIHARLERGLKLARPDVVLVCYGMNDGIYAPPDPARRAAYERGINTVVEAIRKAGAGVIVGTPPPFDPASVKSNLWPLGAKDYGYTHPFEGYDEVLGGYADWLISRRGEGWAVADIHGSTLALVKAMQAEDPKFTLARDGVHPDANGHLLIARAYLEAWKMPAEVDAAAIDARSQKATAGKVEAIRLDDGTLSFTWTTRIPMPADPSWNAAVVARSRINEDFNQHRLTIAGLDRPRYDLYEGEAKLGEATREQLARGIDLREFARLSTNRRSAELWPLIARRRSLFDPSWLEAVGHGPPHRPGGELTIDQAWSRAEQVDARIRELARPTPISLRLVPVDMKE